MLKRTVVICFITLLTCSPLPAQGYFCSRKGARLEYVRKTTRGEFVWRHVMTVTDVAADGTVTTSSDFLKADGKNMYSGPVIEKTRVDAGTGEVILDMGKALASYIKARTRLDATGSGKLSVLPSGMQPGDTLASVQAQAKIGPLKYTVSVYSRKVLRRETITVPAGSFECIVIREFKKESGPGHNREVGNISWYSKDVGYVRHDTYKKEGSLLTREELYSIQ